ncbi:PGF-pre-PGF domain-containing protein [Bacteroides sp.]|uniref:PGF-pre-PGF domain-containing protein n=1 Tax=Bacteroides sp. TaxID=29523 RepID=UPI00261F7224|nr:PGF-pre-PGF domain-containing protein [Bacteroides sp.]MDD3041086.1 PGF-pre-PGF domain-containing protein [Bacteroides sp.]
MENKKKLYPISVVSIAFVFFFSVCISSLISTAFAQSADGQLSFNETQITTSQSSLYFPDIYDDRVVWIDESNGNWDIYMYNLSTSKETKITTNGSNKADSAIYGNKIVWVDYRNGNSDIYMYDLSTYEETQITTNVSEKANPAIYGNRIVWEDHRGWGNSNIYMYDLFNHTETQITTNYSDQRAPSIYEDRIVWHGYRNGKNKICLYNLSTSDETIITSNASEQAYPTIYGDRIVWEDMRNGLGNSDIYMYNLSNNKETQITTDESNQYSPVIYGDIIVWEDWRNGCRDIYLYNLSAFTVAQVTNDGSDHYSPAIYGDWLVWTDNRNGVSKFDIYACNLIDSEVIKTINSQATLVETQITTNPSSQEAPAIYGDIIVWQDWRNGYSNSDIYMYNLSNNKETQITTDESNQYSPVIYGDIIVWEDWRNGYSNPDIYMYNLSTHTEMQITTNDSYQLDPAIYGDIIVWMDYRNFNPSGLVSEIYVYNLSNNKETQITTDELEQGFPVIYSDMIIWQEFGAYGDSNIYMYDISTYKKTKITNDGLNHFSPAIWGDRVVWQGSRNNYKRILMHNISTSKKTLITTNKSTKEFPSIYGDTIVWTDYRNGNGMPINPDIYSYNLSTNTETQVTTNKSDQKNPRIYGNKVVWEDWRNGNSDIFMCTISIEKAESNSPVADFSINVTNGYAPLSVQFTDLSKNAISRSWDVNGDGIEDSNEASFIYKYNSRGIYTAKLTVINANGTNSKSTTVTVLERPIAVLPVANFSTSVTGGYAPLPVTFSDLSQNATSRIWDFGDGTNSVDRNPTHIYSIAGNYTVNLTVSNTNGTDSKIATINVFKTSEPVEYIGPFAYITNAKSNKVSVIDTTTNNIIATINVGSDPWGVAVSSDGTKAYIANVYSNSISIIDTTTNTVISTVNVGREPFGVAVSPDGTKVYVANYLSDTVSVIDTKTNAVTATVDVALYPFGIAVNPDGTKVYVTSNYHTISVIDTITNTVIAKVNGILNPWGVAVNPEGTRVYVSSRSNTINVINTTTNTVIAIVRVGVDPSGVVVTPDGKNVYVANYESGNVSVIDSITNNVTAHVDVGSYPYGIAVTPDGKNVYVTNWGSSSVSVIDTKTNTVTATVNLENRPLSFGQFIGGPCQKPILPVVNFSTSTTCGYAPLTVTFIDLSQNATSRSWDFNGDGIEDSNKASFDYTYTSAGTYTVNLTVSNAKGTVSKTAQIAVEKKSSGGSSGGGGGGSPEPARNIETKELSQAYVTNGKNIEFDFAKNATCVTYVSFGSKKTAGKTTTIVEQLKNKSALVSEMPEGEVYKSFNVWVGNSGFATSKNIENPVIGFRVEKAWIKDKKIDQTSIALNRYNDENKWERLPASLSGEDDEFLYFTATVSGFSSFAITGTVKGTSGENATDMESEKEIQLAKGAEENTGSTRDNTGQASKQREDTKASGFGIISGVLCLFCMFLYRNGGS